MAVDYKLAVNIRLIYIAFFVRSILSSEVITPESGALENEGRVSKELFHQLSEKMSQLQTVVNRYPKELENVRSECKMEMVDLQLQHSMEIRNLREEFLSQLYVLQKQHDKQIKHLTQRLDSMGSHIHPFRPVKSSLDADQMSKDAMTRTFTESNVGYGHNSSTKINNTITKDVERMSRTAGIKRQVADARAAFFAKLSINTEHFGYNQPIIFDNVTTNVGNHYDKRVGVFRAPVSGVYLFSTTITSLQKSSGHFGFFINNMRETWFYNNGNENSWDESSQTIIVHLKQDDDVTLRSLEADHGVTGGGHSSISGVLLFEEDSQSIVIGK